MKVKKSRPVYITREYPLIFIYLTAISLSLMYVISRSQIVVCTIAMSALCIGVYMLFYLLRQHRGFAALAALALGFVCMTVLSMGRYPRRGNSILDFIFTASTFFDPVYAAMCIVVFSVIIGFTCCYFSVYSPRPCFLMLPSFIPLILSARTAGGLPEGMLIFMLAGFAASAAVMAQPEFVQDTVYISDKRSVRDRVIAIFAAGAVLTGLLAIIPRSDKTPQGDYLNDVFSDSGGYYGASERLTNFLMSSSVNTGGNSPQGNLLFVAKTESPVLIVRWAFDEYNGSRGWHTSPEFDTGYADWQNSAPDRSAAELIYKLKNAVEEGGLEKYSELLEDIPYSVSAVDGTPLKDDTSHLASELAIQISDGSETSVILHANHTYHLRTEGYAGRSFRTVRDEIFTETNLYSNAFYRSNYFSDAPNERFIKAMETVDFRQLVADAAEENVITNSAADALIDESEFAERYRSSTYDAGMTERIEALAREITAGLTSDYDKARAIERWFGESGFVYDMEFVPAVVDAEYFIFSSKTGICSDFATAATLIARAAGLTARYTEGFSLAGAAIEDGLYRVTDAEAHAFTSVYLDGYGWLTIDPTQYVPVVEGHETGNAVLLLIVVTAGILAIVGFIFRRRLSELIFALSMPFRSRESRIRGIYLRTRALACSIRRINPAGAAVGEVGEIVAKALSLPEQAEKICRAADELFYGSGTDADAKELFACYKEIRRMKRRMNK